MGSAVFVISPFHQQESPPPEAMHWIICLSLMVLLKSTDAYDFFWIKDVDGHNSYQVYTNNAVYTIINNIEDKTEQCTSTCAYTCSTGQKCWLTFRCGEYELHSHLDFDRIGSIFRKEIAFKDLPDSIKKTPPTKPSNLAVKPKTADAQNTNIFKHNAEGQKMSFTILAEKTYKNYQRLFEKLGNALKAC